MTWTMKVGEGSLDVMLTQGMRGTEWTQLRDAILQRPTLALRVTFLVPPGPADAGDVQALDDLIRILRARGVEAVRRVSGPPPVPPVPAEPWIVSMLPDRSLLVDLRTGVDDPGWIELSDAIIQELPSVHRLRFVAPELSPGEEQRLGTLVTLLERLGLEVERR
jgi:hypothetical protein